MTSVFDHSWMTGLFGDKRVAEHLSAEVQLAHMLRIEAAHSRSLGNERAARAIEAAQIRKDDLAEGTAMDGLPVPQLVRCLKAQISPELHGDIHQGLTSQDVMDTALVLSLKDILPILRQRLIALQEDLAQLTQTHGAAALMGRTRMQAALEITVADRLATWRMPLARHLERLDELSTRVLSVQCGGPVGLQKLARHARWIWRIGQLVVAGVWQLGQDRHGYFAHDAARRGRDALARRRRVFGHAP